MRRLFLTSLIVFLTAAHAFAGISYKVESRTSGGQPGLSGTVRAEGNSFRMDVVTGDGVTLHNGSVLLSRDGGKTLIIIAPDGKTYSEVKLDDVAGELAPLLQQFDASFTDPKVTTRDLGDGGKIQGYPTRRSTSEASFTVTMKVAGQEMNLPIAITTESWLTDKIDPASMSVLQLRGTKTGIPALDKMMAAQKVTGFPLKQVTTVTTGGVVMTNTMTVTEVKVGKVEGKVFVVPEGVRRVQ